MKKIARKIARASITKTLTVAAVVAGSAVASQAADATSMPDPAAQLTTLTTIAYNAAAIGAAIFLWFKGKAFVSRLAR